MLIGKMDKKKYITSENTVWELLWIYSDASPWNYAAKNVDVQARRVNDHHHITWIGLAEFEFIQKKKTLEHFNYYTSRTWFIYIYSL